MSQPAFYRFFKDAIPDHMVWDDQKGAYRLASTLFKTAEVSVDDGEKCTASETSARNEPCGVAGLPKSKVVAIKVREQTLTVVPAPEDGNGAHCLLVRPGDCRSADAKRFATELRLVSRIVTPYPQKKMLHGDGTPAT